jgi:hypothetical protein
MRSSLIARPGIAAARKRLLRKRTLNQLLVLHFVLAAPVIVAAFAFRGPFPLIGYCYLSLGWPLLRIANRRAWRRHFRPKPTAAPPVDHSV